MASMRRLSLLLVALLASCGQSSSLTIEVLHPTTFPQTAAGDVKVSILAADGKAVLQQTVPLKSLAQRHLADGLSFSEGKPYVLRLEASGLTGGPCSRAVGQTTFTYRGSGSQRVYFDCADASSATGGLLTSRGGHTATYLAKLSQVVIAGGATVESLADLAKASGHTSLESYSLADGQVYALTGDTLDPGRVGHQAIAWGEDQAVLLGGIKRNTGLPPLLGLTEVRRIQTPETGKVEVKNVDTSMRQARGLHAIVPLKEGRALLVGGAESFNILFEPQAAAQGAEIYDVKEGKPVPTPVAGTGTVRIYPAAAPFGANRALVAGGSVQKSSTPVTQLQYFCGEKGGFCTCTPPCFQDGPSLGERLYLTATYVPCADGTSGAVYLVGGLEKPLGKDVPHAEIHCVSTSDTGRLQPYGSLKTARSSHTTTLVRGGNGQRLFVAGGTNGGSLSTAEVVPVTCDCKPGGPITQVTLRANRTGHTATLLPDGTVLLAGGYSESTVERFNPDL